MIQQRERPRHRQGKQPMFRSAKKSVKKKEKVEKIDPDQLAFRLYLGELEAGPNQGAAAQKWGSLFLHLWWSFD